MMAIALLQLVLPVAHVFGQFGFFVCINLTSSTPFSYVKLTGWRIDWFLIACSYKNGLVRLDLSEYPLLPSRYFGSRVSPFLIIFETARKANLLAKGSTKQYQYCSVSKICIVINIISDSSRFVTRNQRFLTHLKAWLFQARIFVFF
jgi:hypothetical protein